MDRNGFNIKMRRARNILWEGRAKIVVVAILLAYAATFILGYYLSPSLKTKASDVYIGFYASWVASILFFSIVGVAGLIYSAPFQADSASFEERIRAFYGRLAPKSLQEYARTQLKNFGGYNESAARVLVVKDYKREIGAYYVEVETKYIIKNIFDDVVYDDRKDLKIFVDNFDVPPDPMGAVEWITVGSDNKLGGARVEFGHEGFSRAVEFSIEPSSSISYEYRYWAWHKVGVENNQLPKRVTLSSSSQMRNSTGAVVRIHDILKDLEVEIRPGDVYNFENEYEKSPDNFIFRFTFIHPT